MLKGVPARFTIALVAVTNGGVVQIEKFRDDLAGLPVIKQQDRNGTTCNTMIFDLRAGYAHKPQAHAVLKRKENLDGSCPYMNRCGLDRHPPRFGFSSNRPVSPL